MTNEELAIQAKNDEDAQLELWKRVQPFINGIIRRYHIILQRNRAFDFEDLKSIAFIAFMVAVKRFDENRAGFLTILKVCVLSQIRRALGLERKRPIENMVWMVSMDAPLLTRKGWALDPYEVVADSDAADPQTEAVNSAMRADVRAAVERLPPRQQAAIISKYYDNATLAETAEILGISRGGAADLVKRAQRTMARDPQLRGYSPNYYGNTGVKSFLETWTSSVEAEVLRKLAWERQQTRCQQADIAQRNPEGERPV